MAGVRGEMERYGKPLSYDRCRERAEGWRVANVQRSACGVKRLFRAKEMCKKTNAGRKGHFVPFDQHLQKEQKKLEEGRLT